MNILAAYVLPSLWRSTLLSAFLGLVALLLPPIVLLAAGFNALVTLRRGARLGLGVSVAGVALLAPAVYALTGDGSAAVALLLVLYLPIWCLALVLRHTSALRVAVEGALSLGVATVLLAYLILGDPAHFWTGLFVQLAQLDTASARMLAELSPAARQALAQTLTGASAASWSAGLILSLVLARAAQARLYNPGGFRQEFYALRLAPVLRWIVLGLVLGLFWPAGQVLSSNLLLVLMVGYLVQGLAIIHAVLPAHPQRSLMLGVVYVLLILAPHSLWLVASLGYFDSWLDWRVRWRGP